MPLAQPWVLLEQPWVQLAQPWVLLEQPWVESPGMQSSCRAPVDGCTFRGRVARLPEKTRT